MGQAALAKKKAGKAGRPGRKRAESPVTLPQGDHGPDTAKGSAQMHNADIVPMHKGDWHWKLRRHPLEQLAKPRGRRRMADISRGERDAGMEIWRRYAETQKTGEPSWFRPFVDASPKGGDVDDKRLRAVHAYRELEAVVPPESVLVVRFVCCFERGLDEWSTDEDARQRALELLRDGLRAVARELGY